MKRGNLLIISGFSGVGKGTVVKYLLNNYSNYRVSVSATTRKPRDGEKNEINYFFLTENEFQEMISKGELLEYANYVGNYYGTPKRFVEKNLDEGTNVILEIEIQGALQVKEKMPEAKMIFILPPDGDALKSRLVGRKTETEDVIRKRLERAAEETEFLGQYEYFVINDKIEKCAENIDKIVHDNNPELVGSDFINQIKKEILKFSKGE